MFSKSACWLWSALLVTAGAAAMLGLGCSKAPQVASAGPRHIRIGMVAKSDTNPVFAAAKTGAFDAAVELGKKYNVVIDIDWRTPASEDAPKQAENVSAMANEHVDGIAVSCSDARTLTGAINDAMDKGVPVVCFDSDAPDSKRLTCYGTDDVTCGRVIMQELARVMNDTGTIAVLSGNATAPNLKLRVQGLRDELKKHPNMHEVNGDGVVNCQETAENAAEKVGQTMAANPDKIDGWAFVGGWPLFTENAVKWAPGTVKCVSCDALPKELDYLRNGQVQELVSQDCYGWGHRTVEILIDRILNGKDPVASKIPNPLTIVTKAPPDPTLPVEPLCPRMGLDDFASYWNKWLRK